MTHGQAVKIITECCQKEMQKLAFDANLYEKYPAVADGNPWAKRAYEKRENIRQALEVVACPSEKPENDNNRAVIAARRIMSRVHQSDSPYALDAKLWLLEFEKPSSTA